MVEKMHLKFCEAFVLIFIITTFNDVNGLKDVSVKIPTAVTPGDTVSLYCQYDLENEPLYTVKWYKGRQEFYRYIPKELPNIKVFPLPDVPGFTVDVHKSDAHEVVLRDVKLSMAGKYRCEVSVDAPSFHTTMVSGYMHVVYLPQGDPKLTLEKQRYSIGETLRGNCTAPPALPPANLTWILNGKQINESFLMRITIDNEIPQIVETTGYNINNLNNMNSYNYPSVLGTSSHQQIPSSPSASSSYGSSRTFGTGPATYGNSGINGGTGTYGHSNTYGSSLDSSASSSNVPSSLSTLLLPSVSTASLQPSLPHPQPQDNRRQSTIIGIQVELNADNFLANRLQLECIATVLQLYNRKARILIDEEKPRLASVLSTRDTNGSTSQHCTSSLQRTVTWLLIAIIVASGVFTR